MVRAFGAWRVWIGWGGLSGLICFEQAASRILWNYKRAGDLCVERGERCGMHFGQLEQVTVGGLAAGFNP